MLKCCYDIKISGCFIRCRSTLQPDPQMEPDSKKWLDIQPTETRYPVHPYYFFLQYLHNLSTTHKHL